MSHVVAALAAAVLTAVVFGAYLLQRRRGSTSDLAARAQAARDAQETRAILAEAECVADFGTWEWDVPSNTVRWSDQLCRIYGVDPATHSGSYEAYLNRVHPDERHEKDAIIRESLRTGEPFRFSERIVRPDGEVRVLRTYGRLLRDTDGLPAKMFGCCVDVTERGARGGDRRSAEGSSHVGGGSAG